MNDPKARQTAFNAESRDQWDGFADHRRRVSVLLGAGGAPGPTRLCVLGAGNCNDLDLPALLEAHREVHLVDLDPDALSQGVARQDAAANPSLHQYGGLDLTGMIDRIATWTPQAPIHPDDVRGLAERPAQLARLTLPGPFDLVASTCLLTQLIGNAFWSVGEAHPQFIPLVQAIRAGHLHLMDRLIAPRGAAILITDVVSSDTFPTLGTLPESALPALLPRLAHERNFFHGVSPATLLSLFRQDPVVVPRAGGLELVPPWRWKLHERVYLVWALQWKNNNYK